MYNLVPRVSLLPAPVEREGGGKKRDPGNEVCCIYTKKNHKLVYHEVMPRKLLSFNNFRAFICHKEGKSYEQ